MTWQQWVLLVWMIIRVPFGIGREISRSRLKDGIEMESSDREKAIAIGVAAVFIVQTILISLVVSI